MSIKVWSPTLSAMNVASYRIVLKSTDELISNYTTKCGMILKNLSPNIIPCFEVYLKPYMYAMALFGQRRIKKLVTEQWKIYMQCLYPVLYGKRISKSLTTGQKTKRILSATVGLDAMSYKDAEGNEVHFDISQTEENMYFEKFAEMFYGLLGMESKAKCKFWPGDTEPLTRNGYINSLAFFLDCCIPEKLSHSEARICLNDVIKPLYGVITEFYKKHEIKKGFKQIDDISIDWKPIEESIIDELEAQQSDIPKSILLCPSCGKELPESSSFCNYCGVKII